MQSSKYRSSTRTQRRLDDGAHKEAEDLWVMSQMKMHPSSSLSDSIANFVSLGSTKNKESLPYNTFKDGKVRHTYEYLSIDQNAEPDTFTREPSPMEWGALSNVPWLLPPDAKYDRAKTTYSDGLDDLARAKKPYRYKTAYAKKNGRSVPYQRTDRTGTTLTTSTSAQASRTDNAGLSSGGAADGQVASKVFWTPKNISHLKKIGIKAVKWYAGGKPLTMSDPDVAALMSAGLTSANFTEMLKLIPGSENIPGLSMIGTVLSGLFKGGAAFRDQAAKTAAKDAKEAEKAAGDAVP